MQNTVIFGNIGPVLGGPIGLRFIFHGAIGPGRRLTVFIDNLMLIVNPVFFDVSFPKISFLGFKEGQIDFVGAHGFGYRHYRCRQGQVLGKNAVDGRQQHGCQIFGRLGRKMILAVIQMACIVEIGVAVAVIGGIDQIKVAFILSHESDRIGHHVLKSGLISNHIMGVHVIGHIIEPGCTSNV